MIALTYVLDLPRVTEMGGVRALASRTGEALAESDGLLASLVGVAEAGVEEATHNSLVLASVWANSSRMNAFRLGRGNGEHRARTGAAVGPAVGR